MAQVPRQLTPVPGWVPIREAAARLGISEARVRSRAKAERVEVSFGCIPSATVDAWAERKPLQRPCRARSAPNAKQPGEPAADVSDGREWITMREAARRLNMPSSWIRKQAVGGAVRIRGGGRGTQMVDWSALESWIERYRIQPARQFVRTWSVGWRRTLEDQAKTS